MQTADQTLKLEDLKQTDVYIKLNLKVECTSLCKSYVLNHMAPKSNFSFDILNLATLSTHKQKLKNLDAEVEN